jgi:hypothetical protein
MNTIEINPNVTEVKLTQTEAGNIRKHNPKSNPKNGTTTDTERGSDSIQTQTQAQEEGGVEVEVPTLDEAVIAIAEQTGVDPATIKSRKDIEQVLNWMGNGVIVSLNIERPRFLTSLALEDLGLNHLSRSARQVMEDYIYLGRRSLLPKKLQDKLNSIEQKARNCLTRHSIKSHWGHFLPVTNYKKWVEANSVLEQEFSQLRDEVLAECEKLLDGAVAQYRDMAIEAWKLAQLSPVIAGKAEDEGEGAGAGAEEVGKSTVEDVVAHVGAGAGTGAGEKQSQSDAVNDEGSVSEEDQERDYGLEVLMREVAANFRTSKESAAKKQAFVEAYLDRIRQAMPGVETLRERFVYKTTLSYIPLPSLLARDLEVADKIYQERSLSNAQHQAEMRQARAQEEIAEAQMWAARRAEQAKLAEQREIEKAATKAELERIRLQKEMERDVLAKAYAEKEQLVNEFYTGIIAQINGLIYEVCDGVAESIERNGGKLTGSTSMQLKNLVEELRGLNFMGDTTIEAQISRLSSAIQPINGNLTATVKPRLDVGRINRTVYQIRREAETTLVSLGQAPIRRAQRPASAAVTSYHELNSGEAQLGASDAGTEQQARPVWRRKQRNTGTGMGGQLVLSDASTAPAPANSSSGGNSNGKGDGEATAAASPSPNPPVLTRRRRAFS